ncbi:ribosomal protein L26 [Culex quinquefasciatus]|uniref:Ribosomal protein L26 n=1 Tax=Culex quinquefasciatus TaxID=7176 RepID=B0X484_CULQU|nr:ribosomal protein L26 [Culex quinquefasciatus]|eukprot:XP_001864456.1 ribosomal protein L26 [Culex quinquefasciatus]
MGFLAHNMGPLGFGSSESAPRSESASEGVTGAIVMALHHCFLLIENGRDEVEVHRPLDPSRKDDDVQVKAVVYIERIQRKRANGTNVYVGVHPFKFLIVKLKMNKDRKRILGHRRWTQAFSKDKGKYTEESAAASAMKASC